MGKRTKRKHDGDDGNEEVERERNLMVLGLGLTEGESDGLAWLVKDLGLGEI